MAKQLKKIYRVREGKTVRDYKIGIWAFTALLTAREKGIQAKLYKRAGKRWRPYLPPFLRDAGV